jgi:hypothetical protein
MSIPEMNLTSTSYAILGMVAQLRSCTTYQLGKTMRSSFDYFWPRARSLIYSEVKRLAALGLQTLETVRDQSDTMLGVGASMLGGYLDGYSPFLDQVHIRALLNDILLSYARLVHEWSERSLTTVRSWDDLSAEGKTRAAYETLDRLRSGGK